MVFCRVVCLIDFGLAGELCYRFSIFFLDKVIDLFLSGFQKYISVFPRPS